MVQRRVAVFEDTAKGNNQRAIRDICKQFGIEFTQLPQSIACDFQLAFHGRLAVQIGNVLVLSLIADKAHSILQAT